jgi:hypothetical protein
MSGWMTSGLARWLLCAALLALGAAASAHTGGSTGYATVTISGQSVRYSFSVAADLPAVQRVDDLAAGIARHVAMVADGRPCEPVPSGVTPPSAGRANVVAVVLYACGAPVRTLVIRYDLHALLGQDFHTLTDIEWPGGRQQILFEKERSEATVTVGGSAPAPSGSGMLDTVAGFLWLGIEHILLGFDHVLFVLALTMGGGRVVSLLVIVTAFTVAHSITLALSALDVVTMPPHIVEPIIALSIAYVAAENIFKWGALSQRWAVSFVFGLVHGFGFAGSLREAGLPADGLVGALVGFNLGVELGQAAIVAVAVPVLLWIRRFAWGPPVVTTISAVILIAGALLLFERALLGEA